MAAKLVALYSQPEDPAAFDRQYFDTHVPLAEKIPGLTHMEVHKFEGNLLGGSSPYYMMAELTFNSVADLKAAMNSAEGRAAGANLMGFAAKNATLLIAEEAQTQGVGV